MEFDEHEQQEEEEEEEEDDNDEEEIGIRLPVTTATSTYGATTKMASGGGGSGSCRYRECLKNHAVNIGGHAVDGCGEFMPAGEEGTLDALKCAACNCHRNFHRKEIAGEEGAIIMTTPTPTPTSFHHPQFFHRSSSSIPAGYLQMAPHLRFPPPLALPSTSGGGGGGQSRDDQEDISNPSSGGGGGGGGSSSRKRFRTKFSQEQKDKMLGFAERLGWRIQKHDEAAVQQFCAETCVKKHVLKVWMHNNKHTLGKKP